MDVAQPTPAPRRRWLRRPSLKPFVRIARHFSYWRRIRSWPPATAAMIAINVIVFVAHQVVWGGDSLHGLYRMGAYWNRATWEGELWRLITPMFLHAGWFHIGINLMGLIVCGDIERLIGTRWWLIVYMASGIVGCAASGLLPPQAMSVGASAAIYGVLAVLISAAFGRYDGGRYRFPPRLWVFLGVVVALDAATGMLFSADLAGHLGGLATGLWFAFIVLPVAPHRFTGCLRTIEIVETQPPPQETNGSGPIGWSVLDIVPVERWDRRKLRILAVGSLLSVLAVAYSVHPFGTRSFQLHAIDQLAYAGSSDDARDAYRSMLREDPGDKQVLFRLAAMARLDESYDEARDKLLATGLEVAELEKQDQPFLWLAIRIPLLQELSWVEEREPGDESLIRTLTDAMPTFDQARDELPWPSKAAAQNDYAMVLATLGTRLDEALTMAQASVAEHRLHMSLDTLAWVHHRRGENAEARRLLLEAIEQEPMSIYHYHLAHVLIADGDSAAARRHLRRALAVPSALMTFSDLLTAHELLRDLGG